MTVLRVTHSLHMVCFCVLLDEVGAQSLGSFPCGKLHNSPEQVLPVWWGNRGYLSFLCQLAGPGCGGRSVVLVASEAGKFRSDSQISCPNRRVLSLRFGWVEWEVPLSLRSRSYFPILFHKLHFY